AQHRRLVGGLAGISAVINGILAHGDALNSEHRKPFLLVVIAGVVAVGAFQRLYIITVGHVRCARGNGWLLSPWIIGGQNVSFKDDLGMGWHRQFAAQRLGDFSTRAA